LKNFGKLLLQAIPDRETGQKIVSNLELIGFINVMAAKDFESFRFIVAQKPGMHM